MNLRDFTKVAVVRGLGRALYHIDDLALAGLKLLGMQGTKEIRKQRKKRRRKKQEGVQ